MGKSIHSITYLTNKIQLKFHSYSHECMLLLDPRVIFEEETAVKSSVIEKTPTRRLHVTSF